MQITLQNWCPKQTDLEFVETVHLPHSFVGELKAQYNPFRFKVWQRYCCGLEIKYSPHVFALRGDPFRYVNMQLGYGHTKYYAERRLEKLICLRDSIREEGVKEKPIVLVDPIVKNDENKGWEIYEGHHRIACCEYLGKGLIFDLYKIKEEWRDGISRLASE